MSIHEDFLRFIAWAGKEGFDVAHSVGDGKYICLSPQTAELWKAWKASKYTPLAVQEYLPSIDDLRRAGWSDEVAEEAMQAYATLRSSSNVADLKDAAQPAATEETGWLIEHSGEILPGAEQRAQVGWLRVQMKFNGYGAREFGFTHDANEALRFARREDAEAVLAMHLGASPPDWYSNPFNVTEHMWPPAPQPQAAPAPEPWPFEHGTDEAGTLNIKPTAPAPEPISRTVTDTPGMPGCKDITTRYKLAAPEPSAPDVGMLALEELHQLGYTVRDGLLYPPTASEQPAFAALFDLAAVLTAPDGKAAIHGSDGDMKVIDSALQRLRTAIINWAKT